MIDFYKDNIMMIEFTKYGFVEMAALFYAAKTTEKEAREEIKTGIQAKTIIATKKQVENVFSKKDLGRLSL